MPQRKWSLIEIADHQGVLNVGGRVGACNGPRAFLHQFRRLRGRAPVHEALGLHLKASEIGHDVIENHRHAADLVRRAQGECARSVVVGGGHDHGYSHVLGVAEALGLKRRLGCINIDAHLDVRRPAPLPGSGSPFFLAIESGVLDPGHLVEFGIQSHCNAPELWDYVDQKQIQVHSWASLRFADRLEAFRAELESLAARVDALVISLDLDALAQAHCPGVSAPQAEGFDPAEVLAMLELAGGHSKVVSLGIFELNPEHDVQDATARFAATAAYHFIEAGLSAGLISRP